MAAAARPLTANTDDGPPMVMRLPTHAAAIRRPSRRWLLGSTLASLGGMLAGARIGWAASPQADAPQTAQTGIRLATGTAPHTGAGAGAGKDATTAGPVLLVLGDSLSAAYGLRQEQGWVSLLARRLADDRSDLRRPNWRVVNASISGETTAGGRNRLPTLLDQHKPALVLIELGGNDALRGLPLAAASANLQQMVRDAHAAGARTLLVGMQIPPNYGRAYATQFEQMFVQVARQNGSALVPFILAGFGHDHGWFQADGIHPNANAQPKMLDNVWPVLKTLLLP